MLYPQREKNVVELTLLLSSYFYGSVVVGIKRANPHLESMAYHQSFFVSDSSRLDSDTVQYQVRLCLTYRMLLLMHVEVDSV